MNLEAIRTEVCPHCGSIRTVYSNLTTYCPGCDKHTDVPMGEKKHIE